VTDEYINRGLLSAKLFGGHGQGLVFQVRVATVAKTESEVVG